MESIDRIGESKKKTNSIRWSAQMAPSFHRSPNVFPQMPPDLTVELCISSLTQRHNLLVHNHLNVEQNNEHPHGSLLTFSVSRLFTAQTTVWSLDRSRTPTCCFCRYMVRRHQQVATKTFIPMSSLYIHIHTITSCATGTESNLFDDTSYTSTGCWS